MRSIIKKIIIFKEKFLKCLNPSLTKSSYQAYSKIQKKIRIWLKKLIVFTETTPIVSNYKLLKTYTYVEIGTIRTETKKKNFFEIILKGST